MRYSTWSLGYVQNKCSESRSVLSGRYSFVSSFSRTRDTKLKRKYMIEQKSGCMGRHPICGGSNRAAETSPYGAYREVRSEEGTVR